MFDDKKYTEFCHSRMNKELSEPDKIHNCIYGLAGESGEAIDLLKKVFFHKHVMTPELKRKLLLELGDVLFYVSELGHLFGFSLEEIARENVEKLTKRYPVEFNVDQSKVRKE